MLFRNLGSFIPSPPWTWIRHVPQMTVRWLSGVVIGVNVDVHYDSATNLENKEKPKLDVFGLQILANIEHSMQYPPTSTLGRRDLIWALEFKARRGKHGRNSVIHYCYIPTNRVTNFIVRIRV